MATLLNCFHGTVYVHLWAVKIMIYLQTVNRILFILSITDLFLLFLGLHASVILDTPALCLYLISLKHMRAFTPRLQQATCSPCVDYKAQHTYICSLSVWLNVIQTGLLIIATAQALGTQAKLHISTHACQHNGISRVGSTTGDEDKQCSLLPPPSWASASSSISHCEI